MVPEPSRDPLPAMVNEYMSEYPAATPATIMDTLGLPATSRESVEYFCAITRYMLSAEANDCEKGVDLRVQTVEWSDVAEWEIPAAAVPPEQEKRS